MATVKYTHLVELGQGAFGKVYRAYDPVLDRHVVLKIIQSKSTSEHITNEARVQAASRIKSIPEIFEVSREKGRVRIAMEWVKGLSLAQFNRRYLPTAEELLDIARLLTAALEDIHQHRLLHGDLNPQNILCTIDGNVSIIDFGFSGLPDRESAEGRGGTPVYTAPEVLDGSGTTSVAADIYSLGAIVIELFFHLTPEQAQDTDKAFHTGQKKPEEVFSNILLKSLWPLLLRCVCIEPTGRWPSARELASELEKLEYAGSRNWQHELENHYGSFLSQKIIASARSFLKKGQNGEAFSLLKESMKWAPDSAEAMRLLEKADFSGGKKTLRKFGLAVVLAACAAGIIGYLLLPVKKAQTFITLPKNDRVARMAVEKSDTKQVNNSGGGPLKSSVPGNPAGSFLLTGFGRTVSITIDGRPVNLAEGAVSVTPGMHKIAAFKNGKIILSKIIEIKPFQKLELDFSKLREAHD